MHQKWIRIVAFVIALAAVSPQRFARAATVNTTADESDGSCGDGDCSLRDAIAAANDHSGADTITFNIEGCGGVCTIRPTTPLPPLTDDAGVLIDGYTQPGSAYATATGAAVLRVELDGSLLPDDDVLSIAIGIRSSLNTVRGLVINRFPSSGIAIGKVTAGDTPVGNVISGNYIGTDPTGTIGLANRYDGIFLGNGASLNLVGGNVPAQRNVLSGNGGSGVAIHGAETAQNVVVGNYIGVDASGNAALANSLNGVWVYGAAHGNAVGWSTAAYRNVIAGNTQANVRLSGANTTENAVVGNYIGTNAAGDTAIGSSIGVYISDGAVRNIVGASVPHGGNVISGHDAFGVFIVGETTGGEYVRGNWIGLNAAGDGALPNALGGIQIQDSRSNMVGGTFDVGHNVISGNGQNGIGILGSTAVDNRVSGNYIGTDPTGSAAIPNLQNGVAITDGAHSNAIGGDETGEGNVISANSLNGVLVSGAGTNDNTISGNLIGLDAAGVAALGNQQFGVQLNLQTQGNLIGGTGLPERNIISANLAGGILITDNNTTNNRVCGNFIGTDASGLTALGNDGSGISIDTGAMLNIVGGCGDGERNVISGNLNSGVSIGSKAEENTLSCNLIGVAADESAALGNQMYGVSIGPDASNNDIGPRNHIAHNRHDGVRVFGDSSDGNAITRNGIHSNGGDLDLGISLDAGANNDLPAPVITQVTLEPDTVFGTACALCQVEVFTSKLPDGEGEFLLGTTSADAAGNFAWVRDPGPERPPLYPNVTATATDANGTSQFSSRFIVTALLTPTPSPRATATPPPTATATITRKPTFTPSASRTPTATKIATTTPTPPQSPVATPACVGDCDGNSQVMVNELILGVTIALGSAEMSACPPLDVDDNGHVTINELIQAVNAALSDCGGKP